MAATYEPIASTTLGSSSSSVTLSGIPGTYTDLILTCRMLGTVAANRGPGFRFNSDTGSNYSITRLVGDGSSASSARTTSQTYIDGIGGTFTSSDWSFLKMHIQSYANTNVYTTVLAEVADYLTVRRAVGLWRSTEAVTSITIEPNADSFAAGSTFALYGIKAA